MEPGSWTEAKVLFRQSYELPSDVFLKGQVSRRGWVVVNKQRGIGYKQYRCPALFGVLSRCFS